MGKIRLIHRWIGVVLCLFFAMWFASGAVLMYVPFPSLSQEEALHRAGPVEIDRIKTSPSDALLTSGIMSVDRLRLVNRRGEPVYIISPIVGQAISVSAYNGGLADVDVDKARLIVEEFANSDVIFIEGPIAYDQWVVSNDYDSLRPFYRAWTDDADATSYYVSSRTGEVVQRTTRTQRNWNYAGAVIHWIYPTVLRKNWVLWDQVVWWLALVGITAAITGGYLGIIRTNKSLQGRQRKISPFRSWMRWHHILGLCAGFFVLTWIVSGWLSMDHGRLFSTPDPSPGQIADFRGIDLVDAAANVEIWNFRELGAFKEAEIFAINGITFLAASEDGARKLFKVGESGSPISGAAKITESIIKKAVSAAWPDTQVSIERPAANDAYGHLRSGSLPGTTVRAILDDNAKTWVHVDASSGRIISVMDSSRRTYRWLYNGLHSLDIPRFVDSRPIWDIVMLVLLTTGFIFSITASVLGVKRIRLSATRPRRRKHRSETGTSRGSR